jgi:putative variant cofactor biosynthesis B12-binding/radical SAM domain protein 1
LKVLLIQAPLGRTDGVTGAFPLGLSYLAGAVKDDIELTVCDPNIEAQPFDAAEKAITKECPDVIGLSLRNIDTALSSDVYSYFGAFAQLVEVAARNRGDAKIVVGGTGFSIFPEEIMQRFPALDFGLFLEGEDSFPALLRNLNTPEQVDGIYYRRGDQVHFTGKACPVAFDALDAPPREVAGLKLGCYLKSPHSMGVQTTRGCSFRCAYCTYPYLQGRNSRLRNPKKVVDEVEHLVDNYGIETLFFADTIFNYPFEHARAICQEMIKRKINVKWSAWYKENFINKQFLDEARRAGCIVFEFSPDGTSQQALDALHKDMTVGDLKRTVDLFATVEDAKVNYNFLRNVPGESIRSVSSFNRLIMYILSKNRRQLGFVGFNSIRIYPHTAIYQTALEQGLISPSQDLIAPTFYDPFPLSAAYFPARATNFLYLKSLKHLVPRVNNIKNLVHGVF